MALQARRLVAVIAAQLLFSVALGLGTNYAHDGKTTYCWHIDEPASNSKLTELDRSQEFSGEAGCPIAMSVSLALSTIEVNTPVNVTWAVQANFSSSNLVNMTELAYGQDMSGKVAQIVHSNVHSCVYQSGCDPFNNGQQLEDKTSIQVANLTDNAAKFGDAVQFRTAGDYSVLAHIIMAETNSSKQFAYAVYTMLTVTEVTSEASTTQPPMAATQSPVTIETSNHSDLSHTTVGIIVGGVVLVVALLVVGAVLWRRQGRSRDNYAFYPPSALSEAHPGSPYSKGNAAPSDAGSTRPTDTRSDVPNSFPAVSQDSMNGSNRSRELHDHFRQYHDPEHGTTYVM